SFVKFTTFLLVALAQIAAAAHHPTAIAPEIVVVPSGASVESFALATTKWWPFSSGAVQSRLRQFRRHAYWSVRAHRDSGKTWSNIRQAWLCLPLPFSTRARTLRRSG